MGDTKAFIEDFTRDIPLGLSSRYLKRQTVPQAQWQLPDALLESERLAYDPAQPGGKILVGALGEKLIGIDDNRHILTVGGSRTGKSVAVIGNFAFYRGSVITTDPKAELATITAARRAALGQKVFALDPSRRARGAAARYRASYNPLSVLSPESESIIEDAGLIADAMVITSPGTKDPHWDESARNFIEGVILHVATDPLYEGRRNLLTVRGLIRTALKPLEADDGDEDEPALIAMEEEMLANGERLAGAEATQALGEVIEGAGRDFYEKTGTERAGVLSTVRRHTKFLDYKAMRSVLAGHDFDLADLKRDPAGITVYLCLPASRMGLFNRWLRIFVNQLVDAMEREERKPAVPVLACLDEFPVLGYMRQLEDAAGQIASFGVKLWIILQDWGQGAALYGQRWESFAANAGILQFFGNNDLTTTRYVSERLGRTCVEVARRGEVGPEQTAAGLTGLSEAIQLQPLLAAEEISRHFARDDRLKRQLVIWAGYNPMMLQRVEYFDENSPHFTLFARSLLTEPAR